MLHPDIVTAVLPYPDIDPVIVRIGPVAIRWYAVAYIAGLMLGWWYVVRMLRDKRLWKDPPFGGKAPMTAEDMGDLFVWIAVGVILGGRLGYVLFYGVFFCGFFTGPACGDLPGGYLTDPVKIIAAWEGGMSFHGGVLGVLLAIVAVLPAAQAQSARGGRSGCRRGAHRIVLRPHRQFHQRRIVGQDFRRAMGDGVSQRRAARRAAPPEPDLRSADGGRASFYRSARADRALRLAQTARADRGFVPRLAMAFSVSSPNSSAIRNRSWPAGSAWGSFSACRCGRRRRSCSGGR